MTITPQVSWSEVKPHVVNVPVLFPNKEAAEMMAECADEGETYEVKVDPKGSGRALVEKFYNGKSEGFF